MFLRINIINVIQQSVLDEGATTPPGKIHSTSLIGSYHRSGAQQRSARVPRFRYFASATGVLCVGEFAGIPEELRQAKISFDEEESVKLGPLYFYTRSFRQPSTSSYKLLALERIYELITYFYLVYFSSEFFLN